MCSSCPFSFLESSYQIYYFIAQLVLNGDKDVQSLKNKHGRKGFKKSSKLSPNILTSSLTGFFSVLQYRWSLLGWFQSNLSQSFIDLNNSVVIDRSLWLLKQKHLQIREKIASDNTLDTFKICSSVMPELICIPCK